VKKIFLAELTPRSVTKKYVAWMNDYEVVKYTDQKNKKHTIKSTIKFVKQKKNSKNEFLYGIYFKKSKKQKEHIGNIKLGPINFALNNADISYFIGNKNYWGKGYTTIAISQIIKIAKNKFKLKKIQAVAANDNFGSVMVLKKNNFKKANLQEKKILPSQKINIFWYTLVL